jgi:hypothetical protein
MEFDAGLGKPARLDVRRRIDSDHLLSASPERERRRLARSRKAQDEDGHLSASWGAAGGAGPEGTVLARTGP